MKKLTTIIIILIIASLGVGVVGAQQPDRRNDDGPNRNMDAVLDAISSATGLSHEDIIQMSQQDGKTLAEIITENGGDVDAVQAEIVAAMTADLTEQIENLDTRVDNLLNNPLRRPDGDPRGNRNDHPALGALVGVIIDMSDLDGAAIREQLAENITLAQVASNAGLDPQAVAAAALTAFEERLNEAVVNERIDEENAALRLAEFSQQLEVYLNTPIPQVMHARQQQASVQRAVLQAAASVLDVEPREVLGAISPDQSLADYVSENGGDLSAVTSAARATLVTRLETAVSNERMSQEDADALLTTLDAALEAALNTAGTFQMRPEGGRGGQGGRGNGQQNG